MSTKNNSQTETRNDNSELSHGEKRVNFSVESGNTKPYDISLMTGKPSNQSGHRQG